MLGWNVYTWIAKWMFEHPTQVLPPPVRTDENKSHLVSAFGLIFPWASEGALVACADDADLNRMVDTLLQDSGVRRAQGRRQRVAKDRAPESWKYEAFYHASFGFTNKEVCECLQKRVLYLPLLGGREVILPAPLSTSEGNTSEESVSGDEKPLPARRRVTRVSAVSTSSPPPLLVPLTITPAAPPATKEALPTPGDTAAEKDALRNRIYVLVYASNGAGMADLTLGVLTEASVSELRHLASNSGALRSKVLEVRTTMSKNSRLFSLPAK
jgi:hypothetical protein